MSLEQQFWYRTRPSHLLLLPLSLLFTVAVAARRRLYRLGWLRSERLPVPVVVVGNITAGGTGKTPLVLWLCDLLQERGYRPGIITRGYGGSERLQEVRADADPGVAGDEPLLLARRSALPVFAARDRAAAARALLAAYPSCDVIVSDDGLQHYRMRRDVEIAVVDGERGFGNGWLLPAGPLREPVRRLDTVDAVVINGGHANRIEAGKRFRMRLIGRTLRNVLSPSVHRPAADLAGKPLHAVAGIGNPSRFFDMLKALGLTFRAYPFPDHFRFRADDLAFAGDEPVLMTEKDAVKCSAFARDDWWFLPVEAEVDSGLGEMVVAKLRSVDGRKAA